MRLATYVHVLGPDGDLHPFGPDDVLPDWAVAGISNPKVWADAPDDRHDDETVILPVVSLPPADPIDPDEDPAAGQVPSLGGSPPPKAGRGASREAWAAYAEAHGVDVQGEWGRSEIIAALDAAGVPTESQ
jgi:hypothetical protein